MRCRFCQGEKGLPCVHCRSAGFCPRGCDECRDVRDPEVAFARHQESIRQMRSTVEARVVRYGRRR